MPDDKQKQFVDTIMSINAPTTNVFGNGLPAMGGGFMQGAVSASSDVIMQLKKDTVAFAGANRNQQDKRQVYARAVEGSLLSLETLSVLSHEQTATLIDELHSFA